MSDLTGQLVWQSLIGSAYGQTVIPVDLGDASPGVYTVTILSEGKAVNRQIVVE